MGRSSLTATERSKVMLVLRLTILCIIWDKHVLCFAL